MVGKSLRLTQRWQSDPIVRIAHEAAQTDKSRSFIIPAVWGIVIIGTGFLFTDGTANGVSLHIVDTIAFIANVMVFAVARTRYFHVRGFRLWVLAGFVSTTIGPVSLWLRDGYVQSDYLQTVPTGLIAYPILTITVGVIVTNRLILNDESRVLKQQNAALLHMAEMLDEDVATIDSELRSEIRSRLESALASQSFNNKNPDSIRASIANLRDIINLVIRPVAHEIDRIDTSESIERIQELQREELVPVAKAKRNLQPVPISALISPSMFSIGSLVFVIPSSYFVYDAAGFVSAVATTLILRLALGLIKSQTEDVRISGLVAVSLLAVMTTVLALSFNIFLKLQTHSSSTGLSIPLGFVFVEVALSVYLLLISRKRELLDEIADVNFQNEKLVALLRQKVWAKKQQLAKVVHGQVQSKFIASALRLSNAAVVDDELLESVRSEIQDAVASLTTMENRDETFSDIENRLADAWAGVCTLHFDVSPEIYEHLDVDYYARTSVSEVLTEAIANALKHSTTNEIEISIQRISQDELEVIVKANGQVLKSNPNSRGYGSRTLDEVTTSWKLETTDYGSVLTATIAIR